jgi:single-strand DNA-binding protein
MKNLNRVQLVGSLGADAEVRQAGDKQVVNVRICTDTGYYDASNNWKSKKEWHRGFSFNPTVIKQLQSARKGATVMLEGSLVTKKYTAEGVDKFSTEIDVSLAGVFASDKED